MLLSNPNGIVAGENTKIPWQMFRNNPSHTGQSQHPGTRTGVLKWRFSTAGNVTSSPAVDRDGTVYVGSEDGNLYAVTADGGKKWAFRAKEGITSSPAIGSDGTIYVGSRDKRLYAVNNDGTLRWAYETVGKIFSSPALASDGTIYMGS
ncbi:MAG: PQQ-binding-like beta-propeller repeat protein, partial [Planctomycetota bacterium]